MNTSHHRRTERAVVTDLFVSDVDHTLLDDEATLSCYSRTTLNRLLALGLRFTVASARSCASLRHLLAGLELSLPVIEFNGAFVSDLPTGRHHLVHALAPAVATDLWALLQGSGHVPFVSTFLAVRGETPAAFERRCIPAGCVAPRRALPAGRPTALGATPSSATGCQARSSRSFARWTMWPRKWLHCSCHDLRRNP